MLPDAPPGARAGGGISAAIRQALLASGRFLPLRDAPAGPGSLPEAGVKSAARQPPGRRRSTCVTARPEPAGGAGAGAAQPACARSLEAVPPPLRAGATAGRGPGTVGHLHPRRGRGSHGAANGEWPAAFLLPPPRVEQPRAVALAGERIRKRPPTSGPRPGRGCVEIHGEGR